MSMAQGQHSTVVGMVAVWFCLVAAACAGKTLPEDKTSQAAGCVAAANRDFGTSMVPATRHDTPVVTGDFNGDGTRDVACLGMTDGHDTAKIFVRLRMPDGTDRMVSLEHFSPDVPVENIRIFREPANTFTTRCGHMPEDCAPDAQREIRLDHESIFLAVMDASGVLIFWNSNEERFAREWLID